MFNVHVCGGIPILLDAPLVRLLLRQVHQLWVLQRYRVIMLIRPRTSWRCSLVCDGTLNCTVFLLLPSSAVRSNASTGN